MTKQTNKTEPTMVGLTQDEKRAIAKLFARYSWIALVGRTPADSLVLHEGQFMNGLQNFHTTIDLKTQVTSTLAIATAYDEDGNVVIGPNGQPQMAVFKT